MKIDKPEKGGIEQAHRPYSSVEWLFPCSMNCTRDDAEDINAVIASLS